MKIAVAMTFVLLACGKHSAAPPIETKVEPAPIPSDIPSAAPTASALPDLCGPYRQASGARSLEYHIPGDPASHPGCTLLEAGGLQCPEDFTGWTPKSKVTVAAADARALLDDAQREALGNGCQPCPRGDGHDYAAGYDPTNYPLRTCTGAECVEVCAPLKARLLELRKRYASTRVATTIKLEP